MEDRNGLNHEGLDGNGDQPISISEVAKKLEKGELDPATLSKQVRNECVAYYKLQKYPDELIGDIVGMTGRSVRRITRANKVKNLLGVATQEDYVSYLLISWKGQKLRVLKEIYSKTLKPMELIKALGLVRMIDKDEFDLLERLGYFRETQKESKFAAKETDPNKFSPVKDSSVHEDSEFMALIDQLESHQVERIRNFILHGNKKVIDEAKQMANNIIGEMKRRKNDGDQMSKDNN